MNKLHTRITQFQGVKTTKVYDLTLGDQKALFKIRKLRDHAIALEETYSDDSIQDYLMELWLDVLNDCTLVSVKEEEV